MDNPRSCVIHFHLDNFFPAKKTQIPLVITAHMDDAASRPCARSLEDIALPLPKTRTIPCPILKGRRKIRLLKRCVLQCRHRWQPFRQHEQRHPRRGRCTVALPLLHAHRRHRTVVPCKHQQTALTKKPPLHQLLIKISKSLIGILHRSLLSKLSGFRISIGHMAGHCVHHEQAGPGSFRHDLQGRVICLLIRPGLEEIALPGFTRGWLRPMQMLKAQARQPLVCIQEEQRTARDEVGCVAMAQQTNRQ